MRTELAHTFLDAGWTLARAAFPAVSALLLTPAARYAARAPSISSIPRWLQSPPPASPLRLRASVRNAEAAMTDIAANVRAGSDPYPAANCP